MHEIDKAGQIFKHIYGHNSESAQKIMQEFSIIYIFRDRIFKSQIKEILFSTSREAVHDQENGSIYSPRVVLKEETQSGTSQTQMLKHSRVYRHYCQLKP